MIWLIDISILVFYNEQLRVISFKHVEVGNPINAGSLLLTTKKSVWIHSFLYLTETGFGILFSVETWIKLVHN